LETFSKLGESYEIKNRDVLSKLDALHEKIISPLREIADLSKREILAELVRISSHYWLLAILLDSGFLSYAEIGEKLGITHESARNLVNRLIKDSNKGKLFSKQETDQGVNVGVSSEVQDEILKKKYRTTPNDSM
jgi:DNA-binding CsgD family transcriptional regulator